MGVQSYTNQQYQKSILYLQQAQKILQYAANCGKTIDRFLIITTLQNQAASYQKLLQLSKSYEYMQAIIFNMKTYTSIDHSQKDVGIGGGVGVGVGVGVDSPLYKIASSNLYRKVVAVVYYLQFAAICSQIQNHTLAIQMAKNALKVLKDIFVGFGKWVGVKDGVGEGEIKDLSGFIKVLEGYCEGIPINQIPNLCKTVRQQILQTPKSPSSPNPNPNPHPLLHFTIGQVMQIRPITIQQSSEYKPLLTMLSCPQLIRIGLYISICYYTIATQLRLIAKKIGSEFLQSTFQFQKSKIFHLMGIRIAVGVMGGFSNYHQHIIRSFKNNYHIDLTIQLLQYLQQQKLKPNLLDGDTLAIYGSFIQSQEIKDSIRIKIKDRDRERERVGERESMRIKDSCRDGKGKSCRRVSTEGEGYGVEKNRSPRNKLNLKIKKNRRSTKDFFGEKGGMGLSRETLQKQFDPIQNLNQNRKTIRIKSQRQLIFGSTTKTKFPNPNPQKSQQKAQKPSKQKAQPLKTSHNSTQKNPQTNKKDRKRTIQQYLITDPKDTVREDKQRMIKKIHIKNNQYGSQHHQHHQQQHQHQKKNYGNYGNYESSKSKSHAKSRSKNKIQEDRSQKLGAFGGKSGRK